MIFENYPSLNGMASAGSVAAGIKRIQEPDIYGLLGITEEFKFSIKILEDEEKYLRRLKLEKNKYITIHRGWDGGCLKNVKAWSLESCGDLIFQMKEHFSGCKIVLIGSNPNQAPHNLDGLDLNLLGKTTLEQVKILLKNAKIHIDNEGGMVHLRHALKGGTSVVLFGPTSKELFGYSENINISSGACPIFCEWLTSNWPYSCPRSVEGEVPCMDEITTEMIMRELEQVEEKFNNRQGFY